MQIFICFTLRLCGVPSATRFINVMFVFTPITGKISDDLPIHTSIKAPSALVGKQRKIQKPIRMAASWNIGVATVMVGKNLNITHSVLKHLNVEFHKEVYVKKHTVLTIIMIRSEDNQFKMQVTLKYFQETEEQLQAKSVCIRNHPYRLYF